MKRFTITLKQFDTIYFRLLSSYPISSPAPSHVPHLPQPHYYPVEKGDIRISAEFELRLCKVALSIVVALRRQGGVWPQLSDTYMNFRASYLIEASPTHPVTIIQRRFVMMSNKWVRTKLNSTPSQCNVGVYRCLQSRNAFRQRWGYWKVRRRKCREMQKL
jgi:hypothetical protein